MEAEEFDGICHRVYQGTWVAGQDTGGGEGASKDDQRRGLSGETTGVLGLTSSNNHEEKKKN